MDKCCTLIFNLASGGYVAIYGASTPTKLASKAIKVLLADEIDRFPKVLKGEGDPLKLALQRTTNFFNRKVLFISTPTVKNDSRIEEWFEKSDKRFYHVPCPDCGHEFILSWDLVKWKLDDKKELIINSVHLQCPACFFNIKDKHKSELLANGKWIATAPNKTMPGFHISSLYSPWVKFYDLAKEYIEATNSGDPLKLREFMNLKLGLSFEDVLLELDPEILLRRREFYNCELPDKVLYITCGVDTQGDRLEYHIIGWGDGYEAWVLQYGVIFGDLTSEKPWKALDDVVTSKFTFKDGRQLIIATTFIDSGGNHTNEVYKYAMKRNHLGVYPVKGRAGNTNIIQSVSKNNVYKTTLIIVGVDSGKSRLFHSLAIEEFGAGYVHFPREDSANCDYHYFQMLTAEKKEIVLKNGSYSERWVSVYARNEALDTFVYALAALEMLNPNFEAQRKAIEELPLPEQTQIEFKPQERRILSRLNR